MISVWYGMFCWIYLAEIYDRCMGMVLCWMLISLVLFLSSSSSISGKIAKYVNTLDTYTIE